MNTLNQQVKIDTQAYESEVNEHGDYKNGFFYFDNEDMSVKISFVSDEYGNIESLGVTEAMDAYGEPTYFSICGPEEYRAIADQIEPHLWGESEAHETEHGLRNSDFISDYA